MKKFYLIIPFILILLCNASSQDFGEFSEDLKKMSSLAEDPEEDAVVIFDKASLKITKDFRLITKRHVRIKVLTEEGKKQANIELVIWHEDVIDDIEAVSVSPDGNEFELDSDNIFIEETERTKKVSFPIPGVEAGSVFDYAYEVRSDYISHLKPWIFQSSIYTKHSEIKVYLPRGFAYQRLSINLEKYDFTESVEQSFDPDDLRHKLSVFTWSCNNLPGIKEEPYTDNIFDNYAQMYFILVAFQNEYVNLKFAESWDYIAGRISKYYEDLIEDDECEQLVKNIVGTESDSFFKAKLIYDYVRTNIKTTDHKGLFGKNFKNPNEVLEEKTGSTSEKSMLLINMFHNAGLDAKPVWISTRANGTIVPNFYDENQFNRLICQLSIKSTKYYLYPASQYCPFGCLTPSVDVATGLLINGENGGIISIKPIQMANSIIVNTEAKIDSEKVLIASTKIQYSGLAALEERDMLKEKGHEIYVEEYLKKQFAEAKLDSFYYSDVDSVDKLLTLNLIFSIPNYLEETDQLSYFSIPFFTGYKENPFIKSKRSNPIDFDYELLKSETVKINLPEIYSISQLPKRRKNLTTDLGFFQGYGKGENFIECVRTLDLKSRRLGVRNYSNIGSLFDDVVSSTLDQIVITKNVSGI